MAEWNSTLYLKFKEERTQPAIDLAARIAKGNYQKVIDLGCGPGNSTAVLRTFFPQSEVIGIDHSENMIKKARESHPSIHFELCDVHDIKGGYDLIFSNACLQWLPDHASLLPELMGKLNAGGMLAVQVPMNGEEPLFRIIREVTSESVWDFRKAALETNEVCSPEAYFDILSACSSDFSIWETVYYHRMPTHEALLEWVRSTRLRPYLAVLDDRQAKIFENEILQRAVEEYPVMQNGEIILRFRRLFFTAKK